MCVKERKPQCSGSLNTSENADILNVKLLGAFKKLRKANIRLALPVRPSVCAHGTTRLPLGGFSLNFIFEEFPKICCEVSLKSDKNSGYFTLRPVYMCDNIWLSYS